MNFCSGKISFIFSFLKTHLAAVSALYTHPDYKEDIEVPYKKLVQDLEDGTKKRRPAVVLDAFAGVGTGIVTLKRLGIAISKIIHVEHDKVASHVHKYNHDPAYNPDLKDDGDIKHVYEYRKWEDLYKEPLVDSIGEFVEKHGRRCH